MIAQPDLFSSSARVVRGYTIESGVPVADRQERKRREWEAPNFPFEGMKVGDSFIQYPLPGLSLIETQNLVSGAACTFRKKQPPGSWQFTTRQIAGRYVRCWRIEP